MAFNLFIAYDLDKPGQNYDGVHARIKSLGRWYHAQQSLFYVHTALTPPKRPTQQFGRSWTAMIG
jgi:hypothetical protein